MAQKYPVPLTVQASISLGNPRLSSILITCQYNESHQQSHHCKHTHAGRARMKLLCPKQAHGCVLYRYEAIIGGGTCLQEGQEDGVEAAVHPDGRNLSGLLHITAEERREVCHLLAELPSAMETRLLTLQNLLFTFCRHPHSLGRHRSLITKCGGREGD